MKKLAVFLTVTVLLFSSTFFFASAETDTKDWTRLTGPAVMDISEDGVAVTATEGVTFYKYTKSKIDVTDFSCTFSLDSDNYWDGHDGNHKYYYSILLTNKAAHSGSQGLFLLLFPTSGSSLRIEGQILNMGYLLHPTYVEVDVPTTEPLTMHGKVVDNNYYEISFDNCKQTYKFEIPENYQFHKDLDGEGYFGFGATVDSEGEKAVITVTDVNGIEMKGTEKAEPTQSENSNGTENTVNAIGGSVNQSGNQQGTTAVDTSLFIVLIVALAVIFTVVVAGFVVLILILNKKLSKQ